jgi:hypothetical protein
MSEIRNRLERERVTELEARQKNQQLVKPKPEEPAKFRDYTRQNQEDAQILRPAGMTTSPRGRMNRQVTTPVTEDEVMLRWNRGVAEQNRLNRIAMAEGDKRRAEASRLAAETRKEAERQAKVKAWYQEQDALKAEQKRREQGMFVEAQLTQSEIESGMEGAGATRAEYNAVRSRVHAEGTHRLPSMWLYELQNLRNSKQ